MNSFPFNKVSLFFAPRMKRLAMQILSACPDLFELGRVRWDHFQNEFPDFEVLDLSQVEHRDVAFLASFETPGDIFEQFGLMRVLIRNQALTFTSIIPCDQAATMERVPEDHPGTMATEKVLLQMLSGLPQPQIGLPRVVVYDIHQLVSRLIFGDGVLPVLRTATHLLKPELCLIPNMAVVFPDGGAEKRFGCHFRGFDQVLCHKHRSGEERRVTIVEGSIRGKNALIVDDILLSCATAISCIETLMDEGAEGVWLYGTHGRFPQSSWKKLLSVNGLRKVWITDSFPEMANEVVTANPNLFQVFSIAETIRIELLRGRKDIFSPINRYLVQSEIFQGGN